jgi:uncharacterized protein DUF2490
MPSSRLPRGALILILLAAGRITAFSQDSEAQGQFLPEIDAFFKISPSNRILALASGTKVLDSSGGDFDVGLFWDHRLSDRVALRGGYRFKYSDPPDDPIKRESRVQLSADLRFPIGYKLLATDRNLVELRWIDGDPSQRYRNRLSLEREYVGLFGKAHTFIASAEVFYDTRHHAWNHQEYTAAVQTLVSQKLLVEVYYQRQEDSISSPHHVNAVGLTLHLFLDARKPPAGVVIEPGR